MQTYSDHYRGEEMSMKDVTHHIVRVHSLHLVDFIAEYGIKDFYAGDDVMDWLGY